MAGMARKHEDEVHSITSARTPASQEIDHRERNYLISMGIRVACFLAFVVVDHPVRWLFAVGAILLPYVAVVIGNSAIRNSGDGPSPFDADQTQLEPPRPRQVDS